jgi:Na+-translocating ferredoxin:NAD+ oxidoreductase RnfG subunit
MSFKGACVLLLVCGGLFQAVHAKTFFTVEQAMEKLFPGEEIKRETVYLSDKQLADIEKAAGTELSSGLVYCYRSKTAVAYLDSHRVRTLPETLMIVIADDGTVQHVKVLAFREPEEYLPNSKWYAQFEGRTLTEDLQLKRGIDGKTGATLTARATTSAVRRALAIDQVQKAR